MFADIVSKATSLSYIVGTAYVAKRDLKIIEEKTEEDATEETHSMSE